MTRWGREIRALPELLSRLAAGWRYEHCDQWEVSQDTGWRQYWLVEPDGTRHTVRASIAVVAWRKGLAKPMQPMNPPHPAGCRCRDCADARGDWEFHCRQDERGPPCS